METLIKNQIVKHLSKFVKNLNPDKISVEILRGKGELQHLVLNETVLTDVLELPTWIQIQRAECNRVAVRVPWTRLKSSPVRLFIDEIQVEIAMTSEFRAANPLQSTTISSLRASSESSYGYANRVAEGMSLYINTLEIRFTSEMFTGSIMLSRLSVESRSPSWQPVKDLRRTRISDHDSGKVLLFKQIAWQLLRIEASAVGLREDNEEKGAFCHISAPLRLITSQGRCRLAVNKSTVDGSVLAGRIQVILDDILWVATLPQVRSAISFYSYVVGLVKKASEFSKAERAEKLLQTQIAHATGVSSPFAVRVPPEETKRTSISSAFHQFGVIETSYHFYVGQVELHLCDDSRSDIVFPEDWNIDSGALQITLRKLACDVYPYHLASGDRGYWVRYKDLEFKKWIDQLLAYYRRVIGRKLGAVEKSEFGVLWPKLMSQCLVVRVDDFVVYCVSETGSKRSSLEKLVSADREILTLPGDQPILHVEFADYYYPGNIRLPVPPNSKMMCLAPVRVYLDYRTLRWVHYVYQDVVKTLGLKSDSIENIPHSDIRIEAIMSRIVLPSPVKEHIRQPKKPSELCFNMSTCIVTNCLVGDNIKCESLKEAVRDLDERNMFSSFLRMGGSSFFVVPAETETFRNYLSWLCESLDIDSDFDFANTGQFYASSNQSTITKNKDNFTIPAAVMDMYYVRMAPVWVEFAGTAVYYPRPMPFALDVPLNIWLVNNWMESKSAVDERKVELRQEGKHAHLYTVVHPENRVKVALNHYQYLYLLRAVDGISDFLDQLDSDAGLFGEVSKSKSLLLSSVIHDVEVNLILPVQPPLTAYDQLGQVGQVSLDRTPTPDMLDGGIESGGLLPEDKNTPSTMRQESPPIPTSLPASDRKGRGRAGADVDDFPMFPTDSETDLVSMGREDELSIATDTSDDDQFVLLETPEGAPFDDVFPEEIQGRIAMAEEAVEIPKSQKHLQLVQRILGERVSIVSFNLKNVELLIGTFNQHSILKLQGHSVSVSEWNDVALDAVIQKLNSKKLTVEPKIGPSKTDLRIPVQIEIVSKGPDDSGLFKGIIDGINMEISNTNLSNLASFLEDDADTNGREVRIKVLDTKLKLLSDKQKEPMILSIERSTVNIGGEGSDSLEDEDMNDNISNSVIKEKIPAGKRNNLEEENADLRRKLDEAKALIVKLARDSYNIAL